MNFNNKKCQLFISILRRLHSTDVREFRQYFSLTYFSNKDLSSLCHLNIPPKLVSDWIFPNRENNLFPSADGMRELSKPRRVMKRQSARKRQSQWATNWLRSANVHGKESEEASLPDCITMKLAADESMRLLRILFVRLLPNIDFIKRWAFNAEQDSAFVVVQAKCAPIDLIFKKEALKSGAAASQSWKLKLIVQHAIIKL